MILPIKENILKRKLLKQLEDLSELLILFIIYSSFIFDNFKVILKKLSLLKITTQTFFSFKIFFNKIEK